MNFVQGIRLLQVAPLDFLQADEVLSQEVVDGVHRDSHMWVADNLYSLVPWSCCVLEAIPWEEAPTYGPYTSVKEPVKLSSRFKPQVCRMARTLLKMFHFHFAGPSSSGMLVL